MSDERKRMFRFWADGYPALQRLHETVKSSGLEPSLLELVKMRASQVKGHNQVIHPPGHNHVEPELVGAAIRVDDRAGRRMLTACR
jgi:hypothetical protein